MHLHRFHHVVVVAKPRLITVAQLREGNCGSVVRITRICELCEYVEELPAPGEDASKPDGYVAALQKEPKCNAGRRARS